MIRVACTFLVDATGALLLQLRDEFAPYYPNVWGLPGGAIEAGETPAEAAERELLEEASVRAAEPLLLFERQDLPAQDREKHYFHGRTTATQADVVLGEGAAMLFVPAAEVLDRPFTPGSAEVIARFLTSPAYRSALR
ncbi:NUDIX domain-containing protein [Actinoplanes awajinensis]|uniref:RNA pyrophosphohydrolase n=1 Tax=Actinoplanes awajinensis subsp. mycoplanecinus TaxID=135947 RepID=A0A0X3V5Z7_9ACTN|nr:NUDIX domain-containing protein [Actinoplanes awajinensis]KUL40118.1 RNA pyrophosphohydrolase [Actinoplanes awajinensis subsp. mycoplanecinus]